MHAYTHAYTHTYTIYTHTYIHTHIYMYVCVCLQVWSPLPAVPPVFIMASGDDDDPIIQEVDVNMLNFYRMIKLQSRCCFLASVSFLLSLLLDWRVSGQKSRGQAVFVPGKNDRWLYFIQKKVIASGCLVSQLTSELLIFMYWSLMMANDTQVFFCSPRLHLFDHKIQ